METLDVTDRHAHDERSVQVVFGAGPMCITADPDHDPQEGAAGPTVVERRYDRLRLTRLRTDRAVHGRIARSDSSAWPFVVVCVIGGASTLICDATELRLRQDDLIIVPATAPLRISTEPGCEFLLVRLPVETIGPSVRSIEATAGRVLSGGTGSVQIVARLMTALAEQSETYAPENPGRLAQHVVGLVSLMCAEISPDNGYSRAALLERAKEYIEVHLAELDLSPSRIAAAQNVSTRTLHRIFESEGLTITGWTRERRLEHCRADLADAANAEHTVSGVGARWGLWDAAHFSRLFKSVYGLSPMAYRAQYMRADIATTSASAAS